MQAWRIYGYGGELQLDDCPVPEAGAGELLVRVAAVSVNPVDCKMRQGALKRVYPFEFPRTLGRDCAGTVVASHDPEFEPGNRIVAIADAHYHGTHAEYAVVPARASARLPGSISEQQAVAFGTAGLSAWIGIMESVHIEANMRVLIHAGAGGVGTVAIQLARHLGAEVIATCGAANIDYVRSLGAQLAIDYRAEDFVASAGPCDVVFESIGGDTQRRSYSALRAGGTMMILTSGPALEPPRADVTVVTPEIRPTTARLAGQLELASQGRVIAQIGRVFSFGDAPAAYEDVASGHARGKVVIHVG